MSVHMFHVCTYVSCMYVCVCVFVFVFVFVFVHVVVYMCEYMTSCI